MTVKTAVCVFVFVVIHRCMQAVYITLAKLCIIRGSAVAFSRHFDKLAVVCATFHLDSVHRRLLYVAVFWVSYSKLQGCILGTQCSCYMTGALLAWEWFGFVFFLLLCRYYPHHYAPYLSDVKGFSDLKIEFDPGRPFLPFQQLMAVLPTASMSLLPEALQVCCLIVLAVVILCLFFRKSFN